MIEALLVVGLSFFNPQVPADSLGTETIDGKVVVVHQVDDKETLYSLARRYGTTVDAIIQFNPLAKDGLSIGQVLKIPYSKKPVVAATPGGVHKVAEKETLYSISRMYNVSIDDIKEWNHLTSNSLSLGQELVIKKTSIQPSITTITPANIETTTQKGVHQVEQKETLFSISRQYNISVDDLRRWNNIEGDELKTGQLLFVAPPKNNNVAEQQTSTSVPASAPVVKESTTSNSPSTTASSSTQTPKNTSTASSRTITISENTTSGDEVIQAGLAELIEGTEGNRKYLALHRTAPVGTILKVRNEMNNREVFVRVMGKLPDTALTDKLIIKVSKSAYDRLGAIDAKFRVEVTYYK